MRVKLLNLCCGGHKFCVIMGGTIKCVIIRGTIIFMLLGGPKSMGGLK